MNVVIHFPQEDTDMQALRERVASVHAWAAACFIETLDCPFDQKLRIFDELENLHKSQQD